MTSLTCFFKENRTVYLLEVSSKETYPRQSMGSGLRRIGCNCSVEQGEGMERVNDEGSQDGVDERVHGRTKACKGKKQESAMD